MDRMLRLVLLFALLTGSAFVALPAHARSGGNLAGAPAQAESGAPVPGPCVEGTLPGGALSMICTPSSGWNGDLVIFAHGYIAFNEPLDFQHLTFGGVDLPVIAQRIGFAFATTSYRQNGLAILEGADDIRELVAAFRDTAGSTPRRTYLIGASEGGIITTLLAERSPELFSGGLAMCGPIGSFRGQINYVGDFRVLFDYFFPGVIPGPPTEIPQEVIDNWKSVYEPKVTAALNANPDAAAQLIRTSKAAIDPNNPSETTVTTAVNVLWYNVFGTNDAVAKVGGNPYGNRFRWYWGSDDDRMLNDKVARFWADPKALANITAYETTGSVEIPLVTLHTRGDEIIPYWHEQLYWAKARHAESKVTIIPTDGYGHCNFTLASVLFSFAVLVGRVSGHEPDYSEVLKEVEQASER